MLTVDLEQGPGDGTLLGEDEDGLFVYVTYLRKLYLVAGSPSDAVHRMVGRVSTTTAHAAATKQRARGRREHTFIGMSLVGDEAWRGIWAG